MLKKVLLGVLTGAMVTAAACTADASPAPIATTATTPSTQATSVSTTAKDDGDAVGAPLIKRAESITITDWSGREAPNLKLVLFDGTQVDIASLRGKPVVLNFWASWCVPCRAEMPAIERSYQKNKGEMAFIGIAIADTQKDAKATATLGGVTYPLSLDATAEIARAYEIRAMPTTVLVDANGVIVKRFAGEVNEGALNHFIDTLLKK